MEELISKVLVPLAIQAVKAVEAAIKAAQKSGALDEAGAHALRDRIRTTWQQDYAQVRPPAP